MTTPQARLSSVLALDPGKHGCGVAYWSAGDLGSAAYVPAPAQVEDGPARWVALALAVESDARTHGVVPDVIVVETMHVYTNGRARPDDLLTLQAIAAAVCARFPVARHVGVEASEWKKQVPREVMAARIEKQIVARGWTDRVGSTRLKTQRNDIMHAIGIGLYFLSCV